MIRIVLALLLLSCTPAVADDFEPDKWPNSPPEMKEFFRNLMRPDMVSSSCCDAADTVKTKFKVEPGTGKYPEDRWYAWLNERWELIPPEKIVHEYAPDGKAYLFVIETADYGDGYQWSGSGVPYKVIACFVRPKGGL